MKKKSSQKISVVQRQLWDLVREYIRAKYGNTCYTCGKTGLVGSNWHTGHMYAKASLGAYLKYDERVLRPQCYDCNINKGGMGAVFYRKMLAEKGQVFMDNLDQDRNISVKAMDHYLEQIEEYKKKAPTSWGPSFFGTSTPHQLK